MDRRTLLASVGTIGIAGTAGCLGVAGLDEHSSEPAAVDQSVLDDTGYDQTDIDDLVVDETVNLVIMDERVQVTNYLTEHEKAVELGPIGSLRAAVFMLLTTPQVSVLGQEFNPVEDMETAELVELLEENYDDISNISHEGDDDITILDQDTTQSRFSADARFDGNDFEVNLHVTEAVERRDDLLVAIGVYPQEVQMEEEDNVLSLMNGVIEAAAEASDAGNGDGNGGENDGDEDEEDDGLLALADSTTGA